jgi:Kef-type K+ transport system membrane component KefB
MIPRGEVGLIFAGMGLQLRVGGQPVLGPGEFAAVVAMVLVTTLVTPPLLRWRLARLPVGAARAA